MSLCFSLSTNGGRTGDKWPRSSARWGSKPGVQQTADYLLTALSVLLFAGETAYFAKGLRLSLGHDNDGDMRTLWNQYSFFAQGIYPD